MTDNQRTFRVAWVWGATFLLMTVAMMVIYNHRVLPHFGWYVLNLQWPKEFIWPWVPSVLAAWVTGLALVAAPMVRRPHDKVARRVVFVGSVWIGLTVALVLIDLATRNWTALQHAGWYVMNRQIPPELNFVGGGRVFLHMTYAWLLLTIALSSSPLKQPLLAMLFIMLLGILFSGEGAFNKWETHRDMLRHISRFGILACGMTLVIITGGIDLAVGSVLGLVAVVSALLSIHWGINPIIAVPLCLAVGTLCGAGSGALAARYRMQPFIATLAMMVFARGLAKFVSGGEKISQMKRTADGYERLDLPWLYEVINARVFGDRLNVITIIFFACVLVSWIMLSRLRFGRHLYAIGGNEAAARLSGVPVARVKLQAYALSGLFAAIAGICQAAQETQGDPNAGMTYELTAIAIVVIGGTSLMGGRGSILLTLLGTLTIGYLEKILSINAVEESGRLMLTAVIIVTAVIMQRRRA
jgi:ribose transport system permease protein